MVAMRALGHVAVGWMIAGFGGACGSDDGRDVDGGALTCSVIATAEADAQAQTITAVGTIQCSDRAEIWLETCVQWDAGDGFQDLECESSTQRDASELSVGSVSSCEGAGHHYRAITHASVNGTEAPEHLSADVACD
jgi:hypothetical protein